MSRRTAVAVLTGAVVLAGLAAPAVAEPLSDDYTMVCLRTDSESGKRDGVCVWVPVTR